MKKILFGLLVASLIVSCKPAQKTDELASLKAQYQRQTEQGNTDLYILKNDGGLEVRVTNYGARIVSVLMADKNGKIDDIALGLDTIEKYYTNGNYFGPTVGRFANRIAKGQFTLDGQQYQLNLNDGVNTLHGGLKGWDKVVWQTVQNGNSLEMTYTSPDMEEGYPGEVKVKQIMTLTPDNTIEIELTAETNKKTIINLTNHTYFNLKGEGNGDILDHFVEINADGFTPIDSTLIPTGEIASVEGTPFDFRKPEKVGTRVNEDNQQLKYGNGYDHNWVLKKDSTELSFACRLYEETSGRTLEIYTTEPAMQFYCGNFLDGSVIGKSGKPYIHRSGALFEPQHYPDSPNHENFPSTVLEPGQKYYNKIVLKFYVK